MPKNKDEFKTAFKAIKKPNRPKAVASKLKSGLDKAIDETTDWDDPDVAKRAKDIYDADPDYMVDLIAYKYAKHFEEGSEKRPLWVQQVPKEALTKALAKVVPNDMSDRLTQAALERAVNGKGTQTNTSAIIFERDPEGTSRYALDKWQKAKALGDNDLATKWADVMPSLPEAAPAKMKAVAETGNPGAAVAFAEQLSLVTKAEGDPPKQVFDHDEILEIARKNPAFFVSDMLPVLKARNQFIDIATDPALRALLAERAPDEWAELVTETPALALLDSVEKAIKKKKLKTNADRVGEMFDAIVNNRGIPLAYAASTVDNNRVILTGGTQADHDFRAKQRETEAEENEKRGITESSFPDVPATQCHMLLHLTEQMVDRCPGLTKKPKITQGTVNNILLTAALSGIPGKGLLDKKFGGNVFDERGKSTDQILFTGDGGINSHTWLVIDGVPYDPVLGTKGLEVAASIGETFDWNIVDRVAEGNKGSFIIKGAPKTPKPKSNKMGFGTGYILTKTPAKYLTPDEVREAKAAKEERGKQQRKDAAKNQAQPIGDGGGV
jgi:hypothetical protein